MKASNCRTRGFTLIEMLVTIAIIAVLAVLGFMGSSLFIKRAAAVKDMANMRTLWNGVLLYAGDNGDTLPGPLTKGQRAVYGLKTTGRITFFLAPYLGYDNPRPDQFFESIASSSWQKTEETKSAPCYLLRLEVPLGNTTEIFMPWGNKNITPNPQPMKLTALMNNVNPSRTWAMTDVDKMHPDVGDAGWKNEIPDTMSHGSYRLAVYFDGSGGRVNKDNAAF